MSMSRKMTTSVIMSIGLLNIFISLTGVANADISSVWQTELAVTEGSKVQKLESIWQPELNLSINDSVDMTFIA
jgi:hypothetical protein